MGVKEGRKAEEPLCVIFVIQRYSWIMGMDGMQCHTHKYVPVCIGTLEDTVQRRFKWKLLVNNVLRSQINDCCRRGPTELVHHFRL